MPEQIQALLNKILEWWRRFTKRQQALIVSITAVVLLAFVIWVVVLSQPTYIRLITCDDTAQSAQVQTLLTDNSINYQVSQDGLTYSVLEKDEAQANILLGSNSIPASGYSLSDVIDGSFSTTEADKEKRYQLYLEERFAKCLEVYTMVDSAVVTLNLPNDDGTILSKQEDAYASVTLTLNAPMGEKTAAGIARYVATMLGNDDTKQITITDSEGNLLYAGDEISTAQGTISNNQSHQDEVELSIATEVRDVLLSTEVYDNVEVAMNLDMSFDKDSFVDTHYYVEEGQAQGYLFHESGANSSSTNGAGGVPGTDSNDDDTTYVTSNGSTSESSTEEWDKTYRPSQKVTTHEGQVGVINYGTSSVSVACTSIVTYSQEQMEKDGTLDELGMTFDQFVKENDKRTQLEVSPDFVTLVAKATGFSEANVQIVAYDVPMFQYKSTGGVDITFILQLVLALLIFAMLGFVVFRSLKVEHEEPVEEEVTLEELIASTQDNEEELEDIGYTEKSEARILIEKFVDEKPEAVASLLRNWLNEDWG